MEFITLINMVFNLIKRCSPSFIIKYMQIKIRLKYIISHPSDRQQFKSLTKCSLKMLVGYPH